MFPCISINIPLDPILDGQKSNSTSAPKDSRPVFALGGFQSHAMVLLTDHQTWWLKHDGIASMVSIDWNIMGKHGGMPWWQFQMFKAITKALMAAIFRLSPLWNFRDSRTTQGNDLEQDPETSRQTSSCQRMQSRKAPNDLSYLNSPNYKHVKSNRMDSDRR